MARGATVAAFAFVAACPASAQSLDAADADDAVATRARPELDPTGISIGSFTLRPSLAISGGYDDNIYAVAAPKIGDAFLAIVPRVVLQSDWSRAGLEIAADGNFRRYADQTINDSSQYGVSVKATTDVDRASRLAVQGSIARRIEPRGTEGDTFINGEPIAYRQISVAGTASRQFGRLNVEVRGGLDAYRYEHASIGGASLDLSDRDYRSIDGDVRVAYAIGPAIQAFASGSLNTARYTRSASTLDRNSDGYDMLGGIAFGLSRLISGEVGIGYIRQNFDDPTFPRVSGLNYAASLSWNPTPLLTVTGKLDRSIQRSPIVAVAGIIETNATLAADYELLRNLLIHFDLGYSVSSYKGLSRKDNRLFGGVRARYALTRNFGLTVSAGHTRQRPSGDTRIGRSYDRNEASVGISIQM